MADYPDRDNPNRRPDEAEPTRSSDYRRDYSQPQQNPDRPSAYERDSSGFADPADISSRSPFSEPESKPETNLEFGGRPRRKNSGARRAEIDAVHSDRSFSPFEDDPVPQSQSKPEQEAGELSSGFFQAPRPNQYEYDSNAANVALELQSEEPTTRSSVRSSRGMAVWLAPLIGIVLLAAVATYFLPKILAGGERSEQVLEIEELLLSFNFDPGEIDGVADAHLTEAIKEFQLLAGTEATGEITPALLDEMRFLSGL